LNDLSAAFTFVAGVLLLTLPRRFAAIPLLLGAAYIARGAVLEVGPAHFTVLRLLVAVGILRVLGRGEWIAHGTNTVDRLVVLWALCLIATSAFHTSDAWVYRAGLVWDMVGSYFLLRIFVQSDEDVCRIFKVVGIVLLPVAALMLLEKYLGQNFFAAFGGVSEVVVRDGHIRARGAFAHPILAGTVGATCMPMAAYLWNRHRAHAVMGFFSATGIVFASTSSGPILMALSIIIALLLWKIRDRLPAIRWFTLLALVSLHVVMNDPVYFLIARIDMAGGSTGWFRAQLIRSSIEHLDEWWLAGTDYSRHWMATGIPANQIHTDITNHLLYSGVLGGLPLMFLVVLTLMAAFRAVGRRLRSDGRGSMEHRFLAWTLGSLLFGHVINFFSISYFDQSIVFFYLVLAAIAALQHRGRPSEWRGSTILYDSTLMRE
jgi:hypothetical protein